MKEYCTLEEGLCHRKELLKHFPRNKHRNNYNPLHSCSDQCMKHCKCGKEQEHLEPIMVFGAICKVNDLEDCEEIPDHVVPQDKLCYYDQS